MVAAVANEAEVQARVTERLRTALSFLPAHFQVEHRLRLRLGHRSVVVDGKPREELQGRSDVVVTVDGRPLLVVELKAPDVAVGDDDIAQALSYARAHDPIVPLACATNGETTIVARSHDGSVLAGADGPAGTLVDLASSAATVAAADCENAIRALLGTREELWRQLLASWSNEVREGMTGGPHDVMRPLVKGFSVPRTVERKISSLLSDDTKRVILLAGRPQAGVTTLLAQVAASCSSPTLLARVDRAPDLLQGIANRLARELAFPVSKDDLRGWLNTHRGLVNLIALIDGVPADVAELVDFAHAGCLRLVLGARIDEVDAGELASAIHGATRIDVADAFDEVEFSTAIERLETNYSTSFFQGAQHVPSLRAPRTLRALVPPGDAGSQGGVRLIFPVFTVVTLDAMSRSARRNPKQKHQLFLLARAFLDDVDRHRGDREWTAATWGRMTVDPELADRVVGASHLDQLAAHGLISWIDTHIGPRILVRFEEELLQSIGRHWSNELTSTLQVRGRCDRPKDVRKRLLTVLGKRVHDSALVPSGEVAVAFAVLETGLAHQADLFAMLEWLANEEPTVETMREGAEFDLLMPGSRLRVRFGEGMAEESLGNVQPWLVLSHIIGVAQFPPKAGELSLNQLLFDRLGSSHHFLYRPPAWELGKAPGLHFHEVDGVGRMPCTRSGIVEPVTQGLLMHLQRAPQECVALAQRAVSANRPFLAWRLYTAASACGGEAADTITAELGAWWKEILSAMVHEDEASGTQR